jgi:hypothetical protein
MFRAFSIARRAARLAAHLAVVLLLSACALSLVETVRANPITVTELVDTAAVQRLAGMVRVTEGGARSHRTTAVTLSCRRRAYMTEMKDAADGRVTEYGGWTDVDWVENVACRGGEYPFEVDAPTGLHACTVLVRRDDRSTMACSWRPVPGGYLDLRVKISGASCSARVDPRAADGGPPSPERFVIALLLAWAVEVPVLFLLLRYVFSPHHKDTKRLLLVGFLVALVTLPLAWYALPFTRLVVMIDPWVYIALVEALVVVAEAWAYARFLRVRWWQAGVASLLANGLSFVGGLVLL